MHLAGVVQCQPESSRAPLQVAWPAISGLAAIAQHHLLVVAPAEVVVGVQTRIDPDRLLMRERRRKEARVQGRAVDLLLLVSRYLVEVSQMHELGNGLVQEDEVAELVVVREQVLLIGEPVHGIRRHAGLPGQLVARTPV